MTTEEVERIRDFPATLDKVLAGDSKKGDVMGAAALSPRTKDCQVGSAPIPFGVTRPMPVTTTRSMRCL